MNHMGIPREHKVVSELGKCFFFMELYNCII